MMIRTQVVVARQYLNLVYNNCSNRAVRCLMNNHTSGDVGMEEDQSS